MNYHCCDKYFDTSKGVKDLFLSFLAAKVFQEIPILRLVNLLN